MHKRKIKIKKEGKLRKGVTHEYNVEYGFEDDSQDEQEI